MELSLPLVPHMCVLRGSVFVDFFLFFSLAGTSHIMTAFSFSLPFGGKIITLAPPRHLLKTIPEGRQIGRPNGLDLPIHIQQTTN